MNSKITTLLQQAPQGGIEAFLPQLLIIVGIFAIFYFLMIRPQQKKQKALQMQISNLSKGDRFLTTGGLYCTVVGIKEHIVTAKIADDVKVEIAKTAIATVVEKGQG